MKQGTRMEFGSAAEKGQLEVVFLDNDTTLSPSQANTWRWAEGIKEGSMEGNRKWGKHSSNF